MMQAAEPLQLLGIATGAKGATVSVPMQIIILLTLLTVLPAAIMCVTPFLRITVVLHFLRQALGTQSTPSNQVLIGLALFLTIAIMQPVMGDIYHQSWEPLQAGKISGTEALDHAAKPLHDFLIRFAREKDIRLFIEVTKSPAPHTPADVELRVLI